MDFFRKLIQICVIFFLLLTTGFICNTAGYIGYFYNINDDSDGYKFHLQDGQINYRFFPNSGEPCYYMISGQVNDLQGHPYTEYVVNIKMVDIPDVISEETVYAFPGDGSFIEDGPSGYATLLPQW